MAGAAVQMAHCSARFPANREIYNIAALGTPETANNGVVTGLAVEMVNDQGKVRF